MPARRSNGFIIPKTYPQLRDAVRDTLVASRRRIEQENIRAHWHTGRLINAHVLLFEERADYGGRTVAQLSRDLGPSERSLYYCMRVARCWPILQAPAKLTWAHYCELTHVADPERRGRLELQAAANAWNSHDLRARIAGLNAASNSADTAADTADGRALPPKLLSPKRGTPGLRAIVTWAGRLSVDLGFEQYRLLPPEQARRFGPGDIVRVGDDGSLRRIDGATKADLFTYDALVIRIVDGDTLVIAVEYAPGDWRQERLRLRGLDCPEMSTAAGRAAKQFVDGLIAPGVAVVVTTSRVDKYRRYLADVFVPSAQTDARVPTLHAQPGGSAEEIFLNNALLEARHAERKDQWSLGDWEKA